MPDTIKITTAAAPADAPTGPVVPTIIVTPDSPTALAVIKSGLIFLHLSLEYDEV